MLRDPTSGKETGSVVDAVNKITDARKAPRRMEYMSTILGSLTGDTAQIHYRQLVDKDGKPKEKDVYINWLKRNVGGKGVN
jgi:hypothetical protein